MTLKVGMIGAGAIADDHCNAINRYDGAAVAAVAEINPQRRDALQKKHSIPKAFEQWRNLLADQDLDAVAIALPNALHAPVSLAAIRAGKHVLLDKPFALNYAQARRVADAAKHGKKVLMIGMNQRYRPDAQALKAIIDRGELGEIYHAQAYWCRRAGSPKFGTWFVNRKLSGGGCLLDIGVHYLDLALHLMDNWQPVSVSGQVYGKFGHRGIGEGKWGKSDRDAGLKFNVEDFATALIKFRNHATLELRVSWVLHQEEANRNDVELHGTAAGASLAPLKLFRPAQRAGEYEVALPQDVKLPHRYENRQANWLDAILGKDKPLCTVEQSLTVQRLIDAIYASSARGREVRFR